MKKMVMALVIIAVLLTACAPAQHAMQEEPSTYYGWKDGEGHWMEACSEEMPSGKGLVTIIDNYGNQVSFPGHWDVFPHRESQSIMLKGWPANLDVTSMPEGFQVLPTAAE